MNAPATGRPAIAAFRRARSRSQRLAMLVGDRAAADRPQVARAATLLGEAVTEARIRVQIGRRGARNVADLEAAEAVADIGRVADLAHLAVADEVDPGLHLAPDAIAHRLADHAVVSCPVDRLAAVLGEHELDDLLGPRQASDMGGCDPVYLPHLSHPTLPFPESAR